ncbi:GNAT family N-acetyltransferase [Actinomycetospora aeridis]|uniref:GNAT family N-acetyltransferase n=1 Tax=Actinomycetospora aeridis TaxID=3129231 RepID=A0ABU8NCI0_9PSEU
MAAVHLVPNTSTTPVTEEPPFRPRGRAPVTLRELGPDEFDVLDTVFAGLSDHSRYLRFHGATPRLRGAVRRKLAAVDGRRHLAVAAFGPGGEPIGIARLIGPCGTKRSGAAAPEAVGSLRDAELAIEVVDTWQGRGVGRRLLAAVAVLGREECYSRLVADVLTENTGMRVLLASVLPILAVETDGHETTLTADLRAGTPAFVAA